MSAGIHPHSVRSFGRQGCFACTLPVLLAIGLATVGCEGAVDSDDLDDENGLGAGADSLVGTSEDNPPWGQWTLAIQYGRVGEVVEPTIPLQVEFREDGTAYSWVCAGAPNDGSFDAVCDDVARAACLVGTIRWDGEAWRFAFPELENLEIPDLGDITPDGEGGLLLSYINPSYSGALFERTAEAGQGAGCTP
ncbi:MAG: hypothetical protein HOW73_08125 [Polyangiaceae bacterium]|nr:hypothetical protein [Polyangiaceae bacterium]